MRAACLRAMALRGKFRGGASTSPARVRSRANNGPCAMMAVDGSLCAPVPAMSAMQERIPPADRRARGQGVERAARGMCGAWRRSGGCVRQW